MDELGEDGLPIGRDPTLEEIAALPKDGPGRLAAVLAEAVMLVGDIVMDENPDAPRKLKRKALQKRAEAAERERDSLQEVCDRAIRDLNMANQEREELRRDLGIMAGDLHTESQRVRELEHVIAPDGMAAASSHNPVYLLGRVRTLGQTTEKLSRFKILTHSLLDRAGVPEFEQEDCRVKARLEWLIERQVDKDRMLHLVGSLLTYPDAEDAAQMWLTELGLMAGMEPDEEFHLEPVVDMAAVRDLVGSLSFAAPEMYGMWLPRIREALGMEG